MNKLVTSSVVALLLAAAPFALSVPASAQEELVDVTFFDPLASDLGLDDGEVVQLPLSLAAETCGLSEAELILLPSCDGETSSDDLEDFIEDEDDDNNNGNGNGDDSSAKAFAPGQLKEDGESAREHAPGQVKGDGESAKESAPGQQKKSGD